MDKKIKFIKIPLTEEQHKELKEGCSTLCAKMSPFIIDATFRDLRNKLKLKRTIEREWSPDYSNR